MNSLAKATLNCADASIPKLSGSTWTCGTDSSVSESQVDEYVANNGYLTSISETTVDALVANNGYLTSSDVGSLDTLTCITGDLVSWDGAAEQWQCLAPVEATVVNALATAELNCTAGQHSEFNGTLWGCGTPPVINALATAELNCTAGQQSEYNGTHWGCGTSPVVNTLATSELNCTSGQVAEYNNTTATWGCKNGAPGLPTCTGTQKLTSNNGTSLVCVADVDTDTDTVSGGNSAACNYDGTCDIYSANINGITLEGNGGLVITGGLRLSNASNLAVWRCTNAGNVRAGVLTTVSTDCGANPVNTGIIVP